MVYSDDSGVTWQTQFRPSTVNVKGVQFIDGEHGYATTQFGVYGTSDGSQHWRRLSIQVSDTGAQTFDFVSSRTVYRWDMAHLEESANGGHNWHVIPLPPLEQIDTVQVMPGGVIHLTGLPVPTGSGMDKFYADVFFTSHDDGQHWDIVSHSFLTSPVHVDFVDRSIGYGRAPRLSLKMANQDQGLFITSDGGRQWTNVNLSSLGDTGSKTLAAYPGGIVFAGEINTSSANSTRTFQPVGILVQADASLSHVTAYDLGQWLADDLTFTSHTDGWLASNGRLFHTGDGGKRFNEVYVVQ